MEFETLQRWGGGKFRRCIVPVCWDGVIGLESQTVGDVIRAV